MCLIYTYYTDTAKKQKQVDRYQRQVLTLPGQDDTKDFVGDHEIFPCRNVAIVPTPWVC